MSDVVTAASREKEEPVQQKAPRDDDDELPELIESKEKLVRPAGGRVRTESEGYGITEEQEKKLLAEDDEDLDVIECYVDDYVSDLEGKEGEIGKGDTVEVLQVVRIVHSPEERKGSNVEEQEEPLVGFQEKAPGKPAADEEVDEDVIQIVDEDVEGLLGESASVPTEEGKGEEPPEASVHVSGETENERILSKPLVKQQVVMEVSRETIGKGNEESKDEESLKVHGQVATSIETQEDSDAEQPLVIADSVEVNGGTTSTCHLEDPDVLQLKLDLCQNIGEMDYEPDDPEDHRDPHKEVRTDNYSEEKLERRFQIKQEPLSPIKDRLDRIPYDSIETIVLSSDDDFPPQPKPKKSKKKFKKKSKQRSKSECSLIEDPVLTPAPKIKQTTSSKSLHSSEPICMDEELLKTGFRMELRKRKSATLLEENVTPPPSKKRRDPRKSTESLAQSKSKHSITSADSHPTILDKPPKKAHKPSNQTQLNSLFADCEKPKLAAPTSILDDGMPLIHDEPLDPFEKVFKAELYRKQPAATSNYPRQTILIDAPSRSLPAAPVKSIKKVHGGEQKQKSNSSSSSSAATALGQKPKLVSEIRQQIMQSLEDDLAMSSSDEGEMRLNKSHSLASKKSSVRKRARPQQKQHIDDYFCPSPGTGDKRDNDPVDDSQPVAEPQISGKKLPPQPQAKRRKKRRISSSSSCDGDTTTTAAAESVSLGGTSSSTMTTNTTRSVVGDEVDVATVEQESAKTDAMRVVLSPLTDEKIEKLRKCNTPKKVRALSKACQTELKGLTWSIYLDQINFRSEYFEKLYQLIKNGREYNNQVGENGAHRGNDFQGVVMAGRDAVLPPTPPERSPQRPIGQANGHARSEVEELLFQRANEIEYVSTVRIDPVARERMERSVRSNFRIPKVVKQPSRSPQDVTSSTQHENDQQQYKEDEPRRTSTGYSNDRPPEQRRQVSAANRSPQRFDNAINFNRPEPEPRNNAVSAAAETVRPLRRTIRNDNVQPVVAPPSQPQPAPAPVPPVENGFPSYGAPEQPPQQYRPSGGNMFQQQQHQIGAYTAPGQDLDVKPNLSALAGVFGPNMINPTRFLDSFSIICQMTIMQMMQQQQQLQFSAMNPQGAAMPPVVGLSSQMMPQHGQLPLKPEPSTSGGPIFGAVPVPDAVPVSAVPPDEISDQISQIFGCIDHLKGRCIKNPCQYSHTLPTESNLRQMLLKSPQDVVMTTYQFIVGQDNLFMRYFPTYAEVMGRRNMRHQLVDAVPHCEQSKRAFSYYRCIVEGLTLNGTLNRAKAVQLVLEKHYKINFDQINVLISLILDTNEDMPQFFQWLDQFSNVQDYHYEIASINRLLKFTARSTRPQTELIRLTYRLILSVPAGTETYIDTNLLLEFVELLIRSNLGLDPEKIRHKYRENELQQSATRR